MECNRDEAVRALEVAKIKFSRDDFVAAKKFVLKAQKLFPSLQGLSQMLKAVEVHTAAESKLGDGERDWYGILQVDPAADDSTIKKQYKKLALLLHPDRNRALGAEAAFKLVGEALSILSDKEKRALHDMRTGVKGETYWTACPSCKTAHQNLRTDANYASQQCSNCTVQFETYWTDCPNCKTANQNVRTCANYTIHQCSNCKVQFLAGQYHGRAAGRGADGKSNSWLVELMEEVLAGEQTKQRKRNGARTRTSFAWEPNARGKRPWLWLTC